MNVTSFPQLSSSTSRRYPLDLAYGRAHGAACSLQVEVGLQSRPESFVDAKRGGKAHRGVSRGRALGEDDLADRYGGTSAARTSAFWPIPTGSIDSASSTSPRWSCSIQSRRFLRIGEIFDR